ncbi:MAG: sigma-70 family RNA polymerase sigma factor [Acidobacteria bacterium]|nr:sigma-70 family RNA polymerase sigma factor [Acidobacteriota bacterium]MCA1627294.1 sigma-70 family RNA polymerase sigma factor [Acidobacteriota bacterium]
MNLAPEQITGLLNAWAEGRHTAAEELFPLIQRELHKIAKEHMRRQEPGHILQTTALVNEAYMRLAGSKAKRWKDRRHFYAVASMAMRHILVDYARKDLRTKRGSGKSDLPLEEATAISTEPSAMLVALDDALRAFAKLDPRAAQVVELRYFGGLSIKETANVLGVSPATVSKDWAAAQLWLTRELKANGNEC